MGGKVLVPTRDAVAKLVSARLAADVLGVPTLLLARTNADAADLVTSDIDENDRPFITGERTVEGFFRTSAGIEQGISRGLVYAPYADLLWCETSTPNLEYARQFAEAIHRQRSEEHTSELRSLMRISYAVFCLQKKKYNKSNPPQ